MKLVECVEACRQSRPDRPFNELTFRPRPARRHPNRSGYPMSRGGRAPLSQSAAESCHVRIGGALGQTRPTHWVAFRGARGVAFSLILLLGGFFGFSAPGEVAPVKHVLLIGCDGFGSISFTPTNTPVLHQLMRSGAYTLHARGVMPTTSSPNWASVIMGAGPEQHGVTSNDWETNKFEIAPTALGSGGMFPTIFGLLRQQRPDAWIACVHDWDGFGRLLEPRAPDLLENVKGSPVTARRAIEVIEQHKPTFLFVHFDAVDHAGHQSGWLSPEYFQAVEAMDQLIGDLLQALADAGIRRQTVVIMTADHGGKAKSHGEATMAELEIPFIIAGPGIKAGHEINSPVNTYDTAATVALLFGLSPPAAWIGRPVREALE